MNFQITKQIRPILLFAFAVTLLGGVSYGGYRYWQSRQAIPKSQTPPNVEEPKPTPITKPTDDPNWNLYTNKEYGFTVEYPTGWGVSESFSDASRGDKRRMKSWIKFVKTSSASIMISVWEMPEANLLEWSMENESLIVSGGAGVPDSINATIGGSPTLVMYSPPGQVPSAVVALLKCKNFIFKISHFTPKNENPLLWDIYEHFLRTFEFENTENIPDKLPEFPMGF